MWRDENTAEREAEAVLIFIAFFFSQIVNAKNVLDLGGLNGATEGAGGKALDDFTGGFARFEAFAMGQELLLVRRRGWGRRIKWSFGDDASDEEEAAVGIFVCVVGGDVGIEEGDAEASGRGWHADFRFQDLQVAAFGGSDFEFLDWLAV